MLNISSFMQSASNSPIFSFATAYVPGVFARRIQSVATSSASAMWISVDKPGVFLPSSMFDRCTTEMSAFSASSPCVIPTSRRKSAMRPPMAEGLQFLFIAFHPFADNTNGDCTSGFVPGNTVSVLFHLPCRNIFFCRNPCHVRTSFVSTHNTTKAVESPAKAGKLAIKYQSFFISVLTQRYHVCTFVRITKIIGTTVENILILWIHLNNHIAI